jgi:hypothetical protein
MNNGSQSDDRRKQKRFQIQDGLFAIVRPEFTKLGQIIDIGMGGLAFRYVVTGNRENKAFEVDIFLVGDGFYLEKVPIKTISDIKLPKKFSNGPLPMRRCGVKFGELTQNQITQLEYFIKNYTTVEL